MTSADLTRRAASRAAVAATVAVLLIVAADAGAAPLRVLVKTARQANSSPEKYLLALGDSLAAGYQPSYKDAPPPVDPATGFPDEGYPGGYAADLAANTHLRLVDLACPGETTASMTSVPAEARCGTVFRSDFGAGSQLQAAEAFLAAHKGAVRLVTIDLGANDLERCVSGGTPSPNCLRKGASAIAHQLPPILSRIKQAVARDDPGASFVGMNYYDPFLGLDYRPGTATASAEAFLSLVLVDAYNTELALAYSRAHVRMAGVEAAFDSSQATPLTTYGSRRLPRNVARVCELTWMCPLVGTATPADIHANSSGYRVIASAFERSLSGS